jgi:hypothetical protein
MAKKKGKRHRPGRPPRGAAPHGLAAGDCRTLAVRQTSRGERYLISVCGGEPRWVSVPARDEDDGHSGDER